MFQLIDFRFGIKNMNPIFLRKSFFSLNHSYNFFFIKDIFDLTNIFMPK